MSLWRPTSSMAVLCGFCSPPTRSLASLVNGTRPQVAFFSLLAAMLLVTPSSSARSRSLPIACRWLYVFEDHQFCKKENDPYHKTFSFMDKPRLLRAAHVDRRSRLILELVL
ncbi:hypothetical protein GOP47_0011859 [Adiantum capillus-veneris]|uniref:Uncharacterized protein n=1 Tax=Adiantum capillus-veneris TaxID=13818 RepID=A0A9D4UU20_ADICA|nr:hypothetical protein GOP47_0011859 [Adiantum capillus-veneris]